MAASPNGQCSETMRSSSPCFSAWAAKPWAVSASATACSAGAERRGAGVAGRSPIDAGHAPGRTRRRPPRPSPRPRSAGSSGERPAEQRDERRRRGGPGSSSGDLRSPTPGSAWTGRPGAAAGVRPMAPRGSRRRRACRGGGGRRWGAASKRSATSAAVTRPRRCVAGEQVDLAAGGVAEGRGDGGDRRGELGRAEWCARSTPVFYLCRVVEIPVGTACRTTEPPQRARHRSDQVIEALRPVEDPELHRSHRRPRHGPGRRHRSGTVVASLVALTDRRLPARATRSRAASPAPSPRSTASSRSTSTSP